MLPVTSIVPPFAWNHVEVFAAITSPVEIRLVPVVFCAQIAGLDPEFVRLLNPELRVRAELFAVEIV
jgi:hypothetical protein